MTTLYDELKAVLDKIDYSEPTDFDLKIYREMGKLSDLMIQKSLVLDTNKAIMARFCNHEHQSTRVENHYTTTRCLDCGYELHSQPLPGVEYDRD